MQHRLTLTIIGQSIALLPAFCAAFWNGPYELPNPVADQDYRYYSFGIEFTLDGVISSVSLSNGTTYGLAHHTGDSAYQSLMRGYLETCHQAHLTQMPPPGTNEARATLEPENSWRGAFMVNIMGHPPYSIDVFSLDRFSGDFEVEILARVVRDLKSATKTQMQRRLNITGSFSWAYGSIVAPDFLWTTIKPTGELAEETNGTAPWHNSLGEGDDAFWIRHLLRKFSVALYRNKFRRDESTHWQNIISRSTSILDISPVSFRTLSHTRRHHCNSPKDGNSPDDIYCGPRNLSDTSIIVTFNNASLSLWSDAYRLAEPFWNTSPHLGVHSLLDCEHEPRCAELRWNEIIEKLNTLIRHLRLLHGSSVDIILAGDSWTEGFQAMFAGHLEVSGIDKEVNIKNVIYRPDTTAASQRAARWSMYYLECWDDCLSAADPVRRHDEL